MKASKVDAIGLLVLVGVTGLGYFGLIHWQSQKLGEVKNRIAELTRITLANDGLDKVLDQERADLQPVRQELKTFARTFVGKKEMDQFLRQFAADAERAGVSVNLLRPEKIQEKTWYNLSPIKVNLEGNFSSMYELICDLETGQTMATLKSLHVQSQPGNATCRAMLTFHLYLAAEDDA